MLLKRKEVLKACPEVSLFASFHKNQLLKYPGECFDSQLSGISGLKKPVLFSSEFTSNLSTLPYCCSDSNSVKLLYLSSPIRGNVPSSEEQGEMAVFTGETKTQYQ